MIAYAAFLRGINVGGNKIIKMDELKKAFEKNGFSNVKTILASGNVIFETDEPDGKKIVQIIEDSIKKKFQLESNVIIRTIKYLHSLEETNPFEKIKVTPQTRLYVTFLPEKTKSKLKIPFKSADGNFRIIKSTGAELYSVLTLSPDSNSIDLMDILQKEFGKKITTRNRNTIEKILKAGKSLQSL